MNIQNSQTPYFTLYLIICAVLLSTALLMRVTIQSSGLEAITYSLCFLVLYVLFFFFGGLLLSAYERKSLFTYVKEYHPDIWEQLHDDTLDGSTRSRLVYKFISSRQRSDDPLLDQHRLKYQVAYLLSFIQVIPLVFAMYFVALGGYERIFGIS